MSEPIIRRILFALDAATDAPASLDAAIDLADRMHAELVGLFVEDMNLLRSAALPFVRQINIGTSDWSAFSTETTERALRAHAEAARRQMEDHARRRHVAFSFRIARGEVAAEIASAAEDVDLVVLVGLSRPIAGRIRLGSSARSAARHARGPVLVLREGQLRADRYLVAYDASAQSDRALAFGTLLARSTGAEITAALLAGNETETAALERRAREIVGAMGVQVRIEILGEPTLVDLCGFARRAANAVLVVGADSPFARGQAAEELMDRVSCPLVIVR